MNVGRVEVMDKLKFLHSVMAPVLESYLITACHLAQTVEEMPGESFESIPCLLLIFYLFHMHFFAIGLLNFFFFLMMMEVFHLYGFACTMILSVHTVI